MCCPILSKILNNNIAALYALYPSLKKYSVEELRNAIQIVNKSQQKKCSQDTCNVVDLSPISLHIQLSGLDSYFDGKSHIEERKKELHLYFFIKLLKKNRIANKC
jgi:hypothetical protein